MPSYSISGVVYLANNGDILGLKQMLALYGPVVVLMDASLPSFQVYGAGIYDGTDLSTNQTCTTKVTHGVTLVGYDTINGTDVWIIRNQYGPTWGNNGYMYLKRDDTTNICGIANNGFVPYLNDCSQFNQY